MWGHFVARSMARLAFDDLAVGPAMRFQSKGGCIHAKMDIRGRRDDGIRLRIGVGVVSGLIHRHYISVGPPQSLANGGWWIFSWIGI